VHVSAITGIHLEMDAEKLEAARRSEGVYLGHYKLDRPRLHKEIREAMRPAFGEPKKQGGGVWQYWTRLPGVGVPVETMVDFGARRPAQFRYSQTIFEAGSAGGPIDRLWPVPGICDLLGFP